MVDYSTRPIVRWPGKLLQPSQRKTWRYEANYPQTLKMLERELSNLGATNVVFQLALHDYDIRRDGKPRADARPDHPGVILTFNSKHGPLSYWTDQYDEWYDNVRAITLSLEALRAVDRHAVNKQGSQYAGYKQLSGAPEENGARKKFTVEEAAAFVSEACEGYRPASMILEYPEVFRACYKIAAQRLHPDVNGGKDEEFVRLQEAAAILEERA